MFPRSPYLPICTHSSNILPPISSASCSCPAMLASTTKSVDANYRHRHGRRWLQAADTVRTIQQYGAIRLLIAGAGWCHPYNSNLVPTGLPLETQIYDLSIIAVVTQHPLPHQPHKLLTRLRISVTLLTQHFHLEGTAIQFN